MGTHPQLWRTLPFAVITIVVALAALLTTPRAADAATPRIDAQERAALRSINAYRAKKGLPAVRLDRRLTNAAEWMSKDMGTKHRFGHVDSLGRNPFRRIAAFRYPSTTTTRGENLAAGRARGVEAFRQWRQSPSHDANMRGRKYRAIGIARVYVPGSPYGWYWTTTYGSRVASRM